MAAIDKLYLSSYHEFKRLRTWAIAYYPELLFYFYDADLTWKEYIENRDEFIRNSAWPDLNYEFPVMNTPLSVDRKLKWICPVPCVRKYLQEQCGVKTRWYHKLFFKGKKHF